MAVEIIRNPDWSNAGEKDSEPGQKAPAEGKTTTGKGNKSSQRSVVYVYVLLFFIDLSFMLFKKTFLSFTRCS